MSTGELLDWIEMTANQMQRLCQVYESRADARVEADVLHALVWELSGRDRDQ